MNEPEPAPVSPILPCGEPLRRRRPRARAGIALGCGRTTSTVSRRSAVPAWRHHRVVDVVAVEVVAVVVGAAVVELVVVVDVAVVVTVPA